MKYATRTIALILALVGTSHALFNAVAIGWRRMYTRSMEHSTADHGPLFAPNNGWAVCMDDEGTIHGVYSNSARVLFFRCVAARAAFRATSRSW